MTKLQELQALLARCERLYRQKYGFNWNYQGGEVRKVGNDKYLIWVDNGNCNQYLSFWEAGAQHLEDYVRTGRPVVAPLRAGKPRPAARVRLTDVQLLETTAETVLPVAKIETAECEDDMRTKQADRTVSWEAEVDAALLARDDAALKLCVERYGAAAVMWHVLDKCDTAARAYGDYSRAALQQIKAMTRKIQRVVTYGTIDPDECERYTLTEAGRAVLHD